MIPQSKRIFVIGGGLSQDAINWFACCGYSFIQMALEGTGDLRVLGKREDHGADMAVAFAGREDLEATLDRTHSRTSISTERTPHFPIASRFVL